MTGGGGGSGARPPNRTHTNGDAILLVYLLTSCIMASTVSDKRIRAAKVFILFSRKTSF
jgi:hypothetical protein